MTLNNHKLMQRVNVLIIFGLLAIATLLIPYMQASEVISIDNNENGELVVFDQDYSSMYAVPDNLFLARFTAPNAINNLSLTYNYSENCVQIGSTKGCLGEFYISGLTPAVKTTYKLNMSIERDNWNNYIMLYSPHGYYILQIRLNDTMTLRSYSFVGDTSTLMDTSYYASVGSSRFTVTIEYDGVAKTNSISINNNTPITTNLYIKSSWLTDSVSYFAVPWFWFSVVTDPSMLWTKLNLYSVTQTIAQYQYVTPIGNADNVPFGFDGPHPYVGIMNGTATIQNNNWTATIWIDEVDFATYSDANKTIIKSLINDGWELGIHYSKGLTSLSMSAAIELMNREYDNITEIFGRSPTSFCSLANADNKSHADYAYANLNMVSRNMAQGVQSISNVGNLYDTVWPWWDNASEAGISFPSFTHKTDQDPAALYSISWNYFQTWVDNYVAAEKTIVPFYEYWTCSQNSYHTTISDLNLINDSMMSFTLDNIGGKSRLLIYAPFVEMVLDADGNEVPYEVDGDHIVIEVEPGDYTIMTESYYRQEQLDAAISPLFAIIPLVIILSVIPMVMGLGRKLK